jgi:hypothetical protein
MIEWGKKGDEKQCKQNVFDIALNYIAASTTILMATLPPVGKLKTDRGGRCFSLLSIALQQTKLK